VSGKRGGQFLRHAAAVIVAGAGFTGSGEALHASADSTVSVWLQTMDSCQQALGSSKFQIVDTSGAFSATVTTPSQSSPKKVRDGTCPLPTGNCATFSYGCVQVTGLAAGDTYSIHEIAMPPPTNHNPLGYAPCNGGSACRSEVAAVTIDSTGAVSARTTNVYPDNTMSYYPSKTSSFAGTAADPIVFHDFGLAPPGTNQCDDDSDADDYLTGSPSAHCQYKPEDEEDSACHPFPWTCTIPGAASHLELSDPGPVTSGVSFNETITAYDSQNNAATNFDGAHALAWSGPDSSPSGTAPSFPASASFSGGAATVSITLFDAESTSLTLHADGVSGSISTLTVGPAGTSAFTLSTPGTQTVGVPFDETLTAVDAYGNVATGYSGGTLSWSGPSDAPDGSTPTYPANPVSFSSGLTTVSITLVDVESTALSVADGTSRGSSATFAVTASGVERFSLSDPGPQTAGVPFTETITALDQYGNVATTYSGVPTLTGPDDAPNGAPPNYGSPPAFSSGAATVTVTLFAAETTALTASDGTVSGTSNTFTVAPASAAAFTLSNPGAPVAGSFFTETISAIDPYSNVATGYAGTPALSGADNSPNGTTPNYGTPPSFSSGVATVNVTLFDAETTALTASDGTVSGTSSSFTVAPAGATAFALSDPGLQVAGVSFSETIRAVDPYANTVTTYTSSQTLKWSGPHKSPSGVKPSFPAHATFSGGVATVSLTLYCAQTTPLTVTQGSLSGTLSALTVGPAAAAAFSIGKPSAPQAGKPFRATVTAKDAYGNRATSYVGQVSLNWWGPDPAPNGASPLYPASATFSAGVAKPRITLFDAETTALSASDGTIAGSSAAFSVSAGATSTLSVALPGFATSGAPVNASVTAEDAWSNVATADGSTLSVNSSDLLAAYPSTVTLAGGQATFAVTFNTPGQQSITVSGENLQGSASTTVA
jgi:hypothetical protein